MSAPTNDTWQTRLREEHEQVSGRLTKLQQFIYDEHEGIVGRTAQFNALPSDDQDDLLEQLTHMEGLEDVLARRIARLDGDD